MPELKYGAVVNYQSITSGKYTVVFSPTAFLSLINSFTNLFNHFICTKNGRT